MYRDDEPIQEREPTEDQPDLELDGNTEARIFNSYQAPINETPFKVLLELKEVGRPTDKVEEVGTKVEGEGPNKDHRLGVDLVTILDTSGIKEKEIKRAMQFLIKKLNHTDRLSVVTDSNGEARRICPLRQTTEDAAVEISNLVDDLKAGSITNTKAALKMAHDILGGRTLTADRRCAIMLMSDHIENDTSDAGNVPVSEEVPLYIFGFGCGYNTEVLKKSYGGIFTAIPNLDNSRFTAFSTPLAGLLGVVIEDLTLTITPLNSSKITKVHAENHPLKESSDPSNKQISPVTIQFGSFYSGETRKVLLNLTLPKVDKATGTKFLRVVYKYRVVGEGTFKSDQTELNVARKNILTVTENEQVLAEEKRIASKKEQELTFASDTERLKQAEEEIGKLNEELEKVRKELQKEKNDNVTQATDIDKLKKEVSQLRTIKDEVSSKYEALQIKTKNVINKRFRSYLKNI